MQDILSNPIILTVLCVQLVIVIVGLISASKRMLFANLATLSGILGTFIGITIGLTGFDTSDVEASVPILLAGLQTAFVTSIAGIVASIIIRFPLYFSRNTDGATEGATIDTLSAWLKSIAQDSSEANNLLATSNEGIDSIKASLVGDEDKTLLTQIQKLRTAEDDNHKELLDALNSNTEAIKTEISDRGEVIISEFRAFASTMAEQNSKALIEALSEIIRDFNNQLTEQFGENFKELNSAVGKLLEWQQNYKDYIDKSESAFREILLSIEESRSKISEVVENSNSIGVASEQMARTLGAMSNIHSSLNSHLEGVAQLADDAKSAFPLIEERLDKLTNQFGEQVTVSLDATREFVTEQTSQLNTFTRQTEERIEIQLSKLDGALEEQLRNSLESLGSQLTSLSEKFVSDYLPLTEKLQRIVQISERIDRA